MMRTHAFLAALVSLCALSACATTAPEASQSSIPTPVAFTGALARDLLRVTLIDANSANARAQFSVRDESGRTVYEDAVSLSVLGYEKAKLPWTEELARERLWLKTVPLSQMEGDLVPRAQKGVGAFWPIADNDALERAKQANRPLLCYVSAPDGYTCAWYDDSTRGGVALIEGAS